MCMTHVILCLSVRVCWEGGGRGGVAPLSLDQPMVLGLCENGGTRDLYEDDARDLCGNVLFRLPMRLCQNNYTSIVLSNIISKSISYTPCRGDHTNNFWVPGRAYETANYTVMIVSVH